MSHALSDPHVVATTDTPEDAAKRVREILVHAAELLPTQGPITAFVFLNTLQGLEDLPFDAGVRRGAQLFGCQPYLSEGRYRNKLTQGRIRQTDLIDVLHEDLGDAGDELIADLCTRFELRQAMILHPLRQGPSAELRWHIAEADALRRIHPDVTPQCRDRLISETKRWVLRDLHNGQANGKKRSGLDQHIRKSVEDLLVHHGERSIESWSAETWETFSLQALWRACREGVHGLKLFGDTAPTPIRHRDLLLEATGEDTDVLVNSVLIPLLAAFVDQGFAEWSLPDRDRGLFQAFLTLYAEGGHTSQHWLKGVSLEAERLRHAGLSPLESICESLELLGVHDGELDNYLIATLLALRGWAGMLWQNDVRSDRVPVPVPHGTLLEYIAVRLVLERFAVAATARDCLNYEGPLNRVRDRAHSRIPRHRIVDVDQRAFLAFQVAQVKGWNARDLYELKKPQWTALMQELESFSSWERRRVFHAAFERRFYSRALDAISVYARRQPERVAAPRFQAMFCIDAREESFRRHLEELCPQAETFSLAGFFGVAMYYRGVADAHYATLCPIVMRPQHWVVEDPVYVLEEEHRRRAKTRRAVGTASHQVYLRSRSMALGALLTAGIGAFATVPMVARVLFPRLTAQIRRTAGRFMQPPAVTRLRLERSEATPGPDGGHIGYSVAEMAHISERMLRDVGLIDGFARMVILLGHGSFCLNNPHKSAYDCGACTGSAGGPNARALAMMLNDRRVREILRTNGLVIPDDTYFVSGLHNTCDDSISYYDLDLLPLLRTSDFEFARDALELACEHNAHERCRRFDSAPLNLSFTAARRHVQRRAEDLAQTRPEFGNATNGMCIVGRRSRTRGLYLDRRAFLMSYDATQDDNDGTILARILSAVVPVCEGINLQYFFSYTDNTGWGSGTKLPHNVTSLLGVMDGASSDLRPGLPWQGVEIHEPVRCLFVIESTPEIMTKIMDRNPTIGRILRNGWSHLAVLDPHSNEIKVFRGGKFTVYEPHIATLPVAKSSLDWYRGWRDHLDFAEINAGGVATGRPA